MDCLISLKVGDGGLFLVGLRLSPLIGDCFGDTFFWISFFLIFIGDLVGDKSFLSRFTFVGEDSKELVEELLEEESPFDSESVLFVVLINFRTDSSCNLERDFGKGRGTDFIFSDGAMVLSLLFTERGSVRLSRTFVLLLTTILLVESTCGLDSN